ncbi:MAG: hypothetical protein GOMPHAMPRED_005163 [Gomphillus americanus]|uniref:Phosphoribosylaminoimidazole-succinocarboxamide synthase n=1 Tax=Gomphillus americanus TaxID=1940652 RepID=A0A8H3IUK2_9LECA|nr:MAG: hypothetical protein GOMPHAMPRED_005163 [Gomphillus americanus]
MSGKALTATSLDGILPLVAKGKVRDLYEINTNVLLFIATDRISAYDVIMANGIPHKGHLLTTITAHWFQVLSNAFPSLQTHFLTLDLPSPIVQDPSLCQQLQDRSMQVRKLRILPIEAIVRGYITGSAWSEYKETKTVHGESFDVELQESAPFPNGPIYTPSTKAPAGEKDENITRAQAAALIGTKHAARVEELALQLYTAAAAYASERGIIIADTKFEFGVDEKTEDVVLVDEVLTPDSSRFWDKVRYAVGKAQESFDKQFLRDWLSEKKLRGKEGVEMPPDVIENTWRRYMDAYERLTGKVWTKP